MKRFNGICIVSHDVPRLREFYSRVLDTTPEGEDWFVAFRLTGGVLSIFAEAGMEEMAPRCMQSSGCGRYTLEIEVENVDEEFQRLTSKGLSVVKPPTTQTWGRRSVWFRDPDGNIVNFYKPVGDTRQHSPSEVLRVFLTRLLNERDASICGELLSAGYRDHDAPKGTPVGPGSVRQFARGLLEDYPDLQVDIQNLTEGDGYAVARIVWKGNHRDTGATFDRAGVVVLRIDGDGKIAERWSAYEAV